MTNKQKEREKIDGRKARWFDCDWNNDTIFQNACEQCAVCKYSNFLDFAHSVGKPEGSTIQYNRQIDEYLKLKTLEEKQRWIFNYLKKPNEK